LHQMNQPVRPSVSATDDPVAMNHAGLALISRI
jgi:hypothetical protein